MSPQETGLRYFQKTKAAAAKNKQARQDQEGTAPKLGQVWRAGVAAARRDCFRSSGTRRT